MTEAMKTCLRCCIEKPVDSFYKRTDNGKLRPYCCKCENAHRGLMAKNKRALSPPKVGWAALPQETKDKIIEMRKNGANVSSIAKKINMGKSRLFYYKYRSCFE